jgi:enoyl-CoA hydratase
MSTDEQLVEFEADENIAVLRLNRPEVRNAQNSGMLYALDEALRRFAHDDDLRVGVLGGNGPHFSSGHDLGTAGVDYEVEYERISMWWSHIGQEGAENYMARECEVYLGLCRRWREIPKPTIAMVHGACIAGGLMLAWACDLIIAADDAVFSDPVVQWGVPGVELFAHPWEMGARQAKEFLFLGEPIGAQRAFELGMVNRVVPRDALEDTALDVARRIASKPRFGLALAKMAVNQSEDAMGYRVGTDQAFALHQLSHAHNLAVSGSPMLGRAVPTGSAQPPDPAGH